MNKLQKIFWVVPFLFIDSSINVLAEGQDQITNPYQTRNQHTDISQRKAISIAQQHIRGRVIDIKRSGNLYRIKILSDQGSIHIVQVNAIDGTIKTDH